MGAGTETAEAADLDTAARYKRLGHLIQHGFDGHVEGGEWQLWVYLGEALDEVGSVHVGQCAPKGWGVGPCTREPLKPLTGGNTGRKRASQPSSYVLRTKKVRIPFALKSPFRGSSSIAIQ